MPQLVIREVGPRDGLQNEAPLNVERRAEIISALCRTGLTEIEAVSFVSPTAVPAMANAADVLALVDRRSEVRLWALVPNERGAEMALAANIDALTVTVSACPVYNERNVRRSIDESVEGIARIVEIADGRMVDVVISCVFGSPYTGDEPTGTVPDLISQLAERGVDRFTLADTTGMATPHRIERVLHKTGIDVGLHLHDTRGTALVNAFTAIGYGVTRFDTAVGGLGGSPFAKGAGGNLATEDLVHLADDDPMLDTGVDLDALLAVAKDFEAAVDHRLPGRIATHGPAR
jgi:hydroxymethylglutaryl-CoA lyase